MSAHLPTLILDFDSTFTRVEALDVLADIVLDSHPEKEARSAAIKSLTDKAMSGEIGFGAALSERVALLKPSKAQLSALVERLKGEVSASIRRNRPVFERHSDKILILSGGFHEFIAPVVAEFGIGPDQIFANRFVFDTEGVATGVDLSNPLASDGGKIAVVRALNLSGDVVMIGDGWTDYEVRQAGVAHRFYAFIENAARPKVMDVADRAVSSFDEVLHAEGFEGRWSYPKTAMKALLLENIHPEAVMRFREEGYEVETVKGALDEDELIRRLPGVHVLGIRSKTLLTRKALEAADKLLAVGAFCIGTNQIDLKAATEKGVAVFNAPYSNTRSVVEMVIGLMVMLTRQLFDKARGMHEGKWDKSAKDCHELRGKTLGIIGYGAIGSQLSVLAEALGMSVVYYDVAEKLSLGNAKRRRTLNEVLAEADVLSLHVDGRKDNKNLIGAEELSRLKPGVIFINLSRGHVVDVDALAAAVRSGKISGLAVDVFPEEPKTNDDPFDSPLMGLSNTILTPHVGGSTEEAQESIAEFASERLLNFVNRGDTTFSVNLPNVALSDVKGAHRFLHLHANQPGVLANLNKVLAEYGLNVSAQHLKTNENLGYVIIDVDQGYPKEAVDLLRKVDGTVKFRTLY